MMSGMNFQLLKQLSRDARELQPQGVPIRPMNIRVPDANRRKLESAVKKSGTSQSDIVNGLIAAMLPEESE